MQGVARRSGVIHPLAALSVDMPRAMFDGPYLSYHIIPMLPVMVVVRLPCSHWSDGQDARSRELAFPVAMYTETERS
jgi:hypothetical protein